MREVFLVEAAFAAVRVPGPLHAFYERIRSRRRTQIALVATARKLTVLAWHLLTHGTDYRWAPPTLANQKRRKIERLAGRPQTGSARGKISKQERQILVQAEEAYRTLVEARRQRDAAASNGMRSSGSRPEARQGSHSQTPVFSSRVDRVQDNLTIATSSSKSPPSLPRRL